MRMSSVVQLLVIVFILCCLQCATSRYIQEDFSERGLFSHPSLNNIDKQNLDADPEKEIYNRPISKFSSKEDDEDQRDYEEESSLKNTKKEPLVKTKDIPRRQNGKIAKNKLQGKRLRSQKSDHQGTESSAVGKKLRPSVNVVPDSLVNPAEFVGSVDTIDKTTRSLSSSDKKPRTMDSTRDQRFMGQSLAEISASVREPYVSSNPTNFTHPDHLPPPGIVFGTGNIPVGIPGDTSPTNGTSDYLPLSPEVSDPYVSAPTPYKQDVTMTSSKPAATDQAHQWFWPEGHNSGPLQGS